jgi:hypothetical protein
LRYGEGEGEAADGVAGGDADLEGGDHLVQGVDGEHSKVCGQLR